MPLSEEELRILRQIEQELASDPSFSERGYRVSRRRLLALALALVAGMIFTVALLAVSFWLAFASFVGVLVIAVLLEKEIRVVGRDRLGNLPVTAWLTGASRDHDRE